MKTLADIPEAIRQAFTTEEKAAMELLADDADILEVYFQDTTGEFDCIGFVGPGGKVTKFANLDKYNALLVLENRVRRELNGEINKLQ